MNSYYSQLFTNTQIQQDKGNGSPIPETNNIPHRNYMNIQRIPEDYLTKRIRKRKPYNYVNSGIRRYLLYLVRDQNYSIKDAASTLNINYSTAKTIIQVYKKSGRIDKFDKHSEIQQQLQLANQCLSSDLQQPFCSQQQQSQNHHQSTVTSTTVSSSCSLNHELKNIQISTQLNNYYKLKFSGDNQYYQTLQQLELEVLDTQDNQECRIPQQIYARNQQEIEQSRGGNKIPIYHLNSLQYQPYSISNVQDSKIQFAKQSYYQIDNESLGERGFIQMREHESQNQYYKQHLKCSPSSSQPQSSSQEFYQQVEQAEIAHISCKSEQTDQKLKQCSIALKTQKSTVIKFTNKLNNFERPCQTPTFQKSNLNQQNDIKYFEILKQNDRSSHLTVDQRQPIRRTLSNKLLSQKSKAPISRDQPVGEIHGQKNQFHHHDQINLDQTKKFFNFGIYATQIKQYDLKNKSKSHPIVKINIQ
eukprot:403359395